MRRSTFKRLPAYPAAAPPRRGLPAKIGPGLITGASDHDPGGIATSSQVRSQLGLGLLWTMLFACPPMGGNQEISARVGLVTGCGSAGNL